MQAGVVGIKCFLTHSGIEEFPNVTEADLDKAMPLIARYGLPLLVHCELDGPCDHSLATHPTSYNAYLASRPRQWENEAVAMMIRLCRKHQCRVHIVHVSSAEALPLIAAAKDEGLPLTADYDLYAVAPRLHRAGSGLVLNARTVIGKSYHDDMGKYTGPESEVVKAINLAAASVGYRGNAVCHHGPEVNNPFPEQDWPITVFSPTGRVFGVSDQNTLEEVAAEIQILDFHFHTNPKYDPLVRRAVERKLRTVQTKMQAGRAAGNVGSVLWNAAQMKKTQDFLSLDPKKHMLFADRRAGGVIVHLQEEQRALG